MSHAGSPNTGGIVSPAWAAALAQYETGPHPVLAPAYCGCGRRVGRIERTPAGALLVAEWRGGGDFSLLDRANEPFAWRCNDHGADALSRDALRSLLHQPHPKVIIHPRGTRRV